jgi:ABC-type sugar transport system permease subunit
MKKIFNFLLIGLFVLLGVILVVKMLSDGFIPLGIIIGACIAFLAVAFLKKKYIHYRWLSAGIVLAAIFTIFPIIYTVFLSFTNMSGGNLLPKPLALERILSQTYLPENSEIYKWTGYKNSNKYLLLLTDSKGQTYLAYDGRKLEPFNEQGIPKEINGYKLLHPSERLKNLEAIGQMEFGGLNKKIKIQSTAEASEMLSVYSYNSKSDIITNNLDGTQYYPERGTFISKDGSKLSPGFIVNIGIDNYKRFLSNDGYRKPMLEILFWNVIFTVFSVFLSFALGLTIALAFENLPGKRLIRALLIIPYPIPVLVSIMVWRGLLNESMGLVTGLISAIFGFNIDFFNNVFWARFALIVINVYLSYPYFYILCSGALKSIPSDIFEAADIDGASTFEKISQITLPLLLVIMAPIIIASLSFNFNNFTLIWGFNAGLPAIPDTVVPMGRTDLLVSFIYRLAFSTAGAPNYGFAAAITVMLFILVSVMVYFQTRNTTTIKEAK